MYVYIFLFKIFYVLHDLTTFNQIILSSVIIIIIGFIFNNREEQLLLRSAIKIFKQHKPTFVFNLA